MKLQIGGRYVACTKTTRVMTFKDRKDLRHFHWRNCRPDGADADALEVSRQALSLCHLADLKPAGEGEGNPLHGLSLEDFCRALTLVAGYHLLSGAGVGSSPRLKTVVAMTPIRARGGHSPSGRRAYTDFCSRSGTARVGG